MLPTQFMPEYYRDAKDIIYAADTPEPVQKRGRIRTLLVALRTKLRRQPPQATRRELEKSARHLRFE